MSIEKSLFIQISAVTLSMRNVKPIGRGKMEKTKGKRRLSKSEREKRKDKVTSFIVLAIAAVFFIFPFLYMFGSSVKSDLDLQLHPEMIFPSDWSEWTFERYLGFFVYEGQVAALPVLLLNSLWSTGATVLLTIVLDLLMAYAVIFIRFKAKKPIVNFLYIWMAIPGVIATAPQFALYATFRNMFNLYEGMGAYFYIYLWLILPGTTSIFNVLLMRNMFASIPMEIIESARSDGAKNRTIFFRIVVPLARSTILLITLFTFSSSWNSLAWPMLILNGEDRYWKTLTLALTGYTGGTSWGQVGYSMATSVFALIPTLIIFLFTQNKMIDGLATTGVKK